jgi:hypothetical protein
MASSKLTSDSAVTSTILATDMAISFSDDVPGIQALRRGRNLG